MDSFVTPSVFGGMLKHIGKWLSNLKRAKKRRKDQSLIAIEKVILATRKTMVYCRSLDRGISNLDMESEISMLWTELSFELDKLKLLKLAKRCQIKGRYWADPSQFNSEFLTQADISLEAVEQLALRIRAEITN